MTLTDAYTRLRHRWPKQSFCITVEMWHHDHTETGTPEEPPAVAYSVWENDARVHHRGATLDAAMAAALGSTTPLDVIEAQIAGLRLVSEVPA